MCCLHTYIAYAYKIEQMKFHKHNFVFLLPRLRSIRFHPHRILPQIPTSAVRRARSHSFQKIKQGAAAIRRSHFFLFPFSNSIFSHRIFYVV